MRPRPQALRVYADADVLFRAATASHAHTAALVLLRTGEFTLVEVISAAYTVQEAANALRRYLPAQLPNLFQLITNTVRLVDDPPAAMLQTFQGQARKKDVINLAAAVQAEAHLLVTYNGKDYFPQPGIMPIMTPGQFVLTVREVIWRNFDAGHN